ncbi:hypothetical protein SLA2020_487050 [Shorea laevis]
MEESLRIHHFEQLPSASEFVSQIESRNVPAVFKGCIKDCKAFSKWNPSSGGLDYLEERAGSSIVEAMLSRAAPVFYGDIRSHERVPLPFSTFIDFCKQRHMQNTVDPCSINSEQERHQLGESDIQQSCLPAGDSAPKQMYLAQVPIMNAENEERVQLDILSEDIQMPAILETKTISSINLWMNSAQARSSTHYDPHNNLLCIVSGCKQVVLWSPSASPMLYPMPIYVEASNHSAVALGNPDYSVYPRAQYAVENSQKVVLHAGDALFIPEGWFHQVDSEDLTIAVNFWWCSSIMSSMSDHMDVYYLRRLLRRLTDREMNQVFLKGSPCVGRLKRQMDEVPNRDHANNKLDQSNETNNLKGKESQQRILLHELEPFSLGALRELVSLVHDHINVADQTQPMQSASVNDPAPYVKDEHQKTLTTELFQLEDDPVAKILWNLEPHTLQNVFLAMAHNFPRTLEALILHLLSPVGAEVLTRKFDEIDQQNSEEDRNKFYQIFYGAFDDQFAAMDVILNGKESFAHQAFKTVLDKYMGVDFNVLKPGVGRHI